MSHVKHREQHVTQDREQHAIQHREQHVIQAWPDRAIAELAARQATIVAHAQLMALGVRPGTVSAAVARARLHTVHHGVFSLVPAAARPLWAAEWAALLACGSRAMLSHHSAARLHGLEVRAIDRVELTVVGGDRGRRRSGLLVHRVTSVDRRERLRIGGMPVTSLARTALDLSASLQQRTLEHLVDEVLRRTSRSQLHATLGRHPGARGTRRLRAALDPERPSQDAWSKAEARLLRLIRRAGLPAPETNLSLGRYKPDLLWRELGVIVEYDSWDYHSGPAAFRDDRERHNHLTAGGYQVIHVTWEALFGSPETVLVWVATALARADARRA